jgi:hypothetical protein
MSTARELEGTSWLQLGMSALDEISLDGTSRDGQLHDEVGTLRDCRLRAAMKDLTPTHSCWIQLSLFDSSPDQQNGECHEC